MGLFGFKKQFWPFVQDGSKAHTIRKRRYLRDKGMNAKPGDPMYLYGALRTKSCIRLRPTETCSHVESIVIWPDHSVFVGPRIERAKDAPNRDLERAIKRNPEHYGLQQLLGSEKDLLAWRDGFRPEGSSETNPAGAFNLMMSFWDAEHDTPFYGEINHWSLTGYTAPERRESARKSARSSK